MEHVIYNGELMRAELARLPLADRALRTGEQVAATIRVRNAVPERLEQHVDRLAATLSAPAVGLPFAVSGRQLARDIATLCAHDDRYDVLAHYRISPGEDPDPLASIQNPPRVTTLLWLEDLAPWRERTERGLRLQISPHKRPRGDALAGLSLGPCARDAALRRLALRAGFDDAVLPDEHGNLLCATEANLFAVRNGELLTPHPQKDGVYADVYRDLVIECAARIGLTVFQEPLTPQACAEASEFFLASCALEVAPVREMGGRCFERFPVTLQLLLACRERAADAR